MSDSGWEWDPRQENYFYWDTDPRGRRVRFYHVPDPEPSTTSRSAERYETSGYSDYEQPSNEVGQDTGYSISSSKAVPQQGVYTAGDTDYTTSGICSSTQDPQPFVDQRATSSGRQYYGGGTYTQAQPAFATSSSFPAQAFYPASSSGPSSFEGGPRAALYSSNPNAGVEGPTTEDDNLANGLNNLNIGGPPIVTDEAQFDARRQGAQGYKPQLDSSFKIARDPSKYFQIGRVFKTLWTEPASGTATDSDKGYYHDVGFGQLSYSKIRRFIVIRKRLHSCVCLPITSYGGQGIGKNGIRIEDHALVYQDGTEPPPFLDARMTKDPFEIIIEEKDETLSPESQINFGKVYTVEHNVKIKNVGRIHKDDRDRLNLYYEKSMSLGDLPEDEPLSDAPRKKSSRDKKNTSDRKASRRASDRGKQRR